MGIRSNKQQGRIYIEPLSFGSAEILVLSGSPVQTYDKMLKEYNSDRNLIPLILMPRISVYDKEQNYGEMNFTSIEWYEGAPKEKMTNRIVNDEYYTISDGKGEIPKHALVIRKNVPPENPIEIFSIALFTDPRTKKEVRVERSMKVYTHLYDNKNYSLKLNHEPLLVTDPLRIKIRSGMWERTIEPQLTAGGEIIPDSNVAYFWDIMDGNVYRPIKPEDPGIICHDEHGVYTRTLKYEAKFLTDNSFRVRACEYDGERPQVPTDSKLTRYIRVKTIMSSTLECEAIQTKGFLISDMNQPSAFELRIFDNRHEYGQEFDDLLKITWKGQSSKAGELEKVLARGGHDIEFIPSEHGLPSGYVFSVWSEVDTFTGAAMILDENGNYVVSDDGGMYVVDPIYE